MRTMCLALCCLAVGAAPALAQEHQHSPYAGQPPSGVASLSLEELQKLQTGDGMGLARAAELNRYPGPRHALELADSLGLGPEQRAQVVAIRQAMADSAVALGARIIERERIISRRFEHEHIDSTSLAEATAELGKLYGELRYVHLAAHLAMKRVLTPQQVEAYDRLRGYAKEP